MTAADVAELVGGAVQGDPQVRITGVASIARAGGGEITFAIDEKHASELRASHAGIAIVSCVQEHVDAPMTLIRVESVAAAMNLLLGAMAGEEDFPPVGAHPSARLDAAADIAADAAIGPGVVVGRGAVVGPRCVLCANAVVGANATLGEDSILSAGAIVAHDCHLGRRVRIGPNSVIGADGFGYYTTGEGVHHRIPHIGNVVIEDDVEIGACSCVDRAKFGSTRVGAGTKIDNLVQVAHNVQIGSGCILAGQSGVAGSTRLGNHVVLGGSVGVRDNISLGDGVRCAAFSAVADDIMDGQIVAGIPAAPIRDAIRSAKAGAKVPELLKRVKSLESRLDDIEFSKDN